MRSCNSMMSFQERTMKLAHSKEPVCADNLLCDIYVGKMAEIFYL